MGMGLLLAQHKPTLDAKFLPRQHYKMIFCSYLIPTPERPTYRQQSIVTQRNNRLHQAHVFFSVQFPLEQTFHTASVLCLLTVPGVFVKSWRRPTDT
jgi:hypothetical protein